MEYCQFCGLEVPSRCEEGIEALDCSNFQPSEEEEEKEEEEGGEAKKTKHFPNLPNWDDPALWADRDF